MVRFSAFLMVGVAAGITQDADFDKFMTFVEKYNRMYSSPAEVASRLAIFKDNLKLIEDRNAKSNGLEQHAVNNFADLTPEEFKAKFTGYKKSDSTFAKPKLFAARPVGQQTASIDWRDRGAVTPVKNQGQCGSCWAFSATEQIETDYFQKYGTLYELSPQQITSCDTSDDGCGGGNPITAYQYVQQAGGVDPASVYPYTSGTTGSTGSCRAISSDYDADLSSSNTVSQSASGESNMLQQIEQSPMSICVDASIWQTYESGIIQAGTCGTQLDHCVQAVGYNSEQNYWIVRNSWGTSWGNDGYVWVEAGSNTCGIAMEATIVAASQPRLRTINV